jgi:hypothetical protein
LVSFSIPTLLSKKEEVKRRKVAKTVARQKNLELERNTWKWQTGSESEPKE